MSRIYVDDTAYPFGRMIMCHLFSPDLDALHAMADRIGVKRCWFQDPRTMRKVSWPHYDIAKSKRALAVAAGAIECDRYQVVAMGAIVKNRFWNVDTFDPLRFFREGGLTHERPRIEAWLAEQGFAQ